MKKWLLSLACIVFTCCARAQNYQIEMIIYSHITPQTLDSEQWPMVTPTLDTNQTQAIPLLPKDQLALDAIEQKLNRQGYQILSHIAWQEDAIQLGQKQSIHLYGGQPYSNRGDLLGQSITDESIPAGQYSNWQVNGTVSVKLDRYFNFNFNLFFAEPLSLLSQTSQTNYFKNASQGLFYFHLLQSRRTRSDELNYIDYPIYGILFKVIPITAQK